ncbi:hypothetical protein M3G91_15415 [Micromonospora chalcea]|uniref:hypothetical protein n=1 Tax=Micromonospora chalcea TaxID=1874 RepID=UPI0021A41F00|nr:hypothetical protein [Micromonospora chalcea]MCT2279010.1 hypothetical protein [Micromonospora chalcea]
MTAPARWYADTYQDAVWESALPARAKLLALAYARHARNAQGDRTPAADLSWLTYDRAMAQASIGKRALVTATQQILVDAGWLVPVRVIPRRPTLYRLAIPAAAAGTPEGTTSDTVEGTTEPADVPTGELPAEVGSSLPAAGSSLSETGSSPEGTTVVPTGERNSSLRSTSQHHQQRGGTVAYVAARLAVDDDEATKVIEQIRASARTAPRSLGAYVRSLAAGDLVDHLAAVRAASRPASPPPADRPMPAWRADLAARQAAPRRGPGGQLARRVLAGEIPHTALPDLDRDDRELADVIPIRTQTA